MDHKVTALIPTYRRPKLLRRTILSLLRQTHANLQVSVFDDASGDDTEDVVRELLAKDGRIRYHRNAQRMGELGNTRQAFDSVDTPYFSLSSDDDFLAADFYENAVGVLKDHPEVIFVILDSLKVDKHANLVAHLGSTGTLTLYCGEQRFDALHSGNVPGEWTAMVYRKEVARIYVEMDNRFDIAADMRFLLRAAARHNFAHLSKVGAFFTAHSASTSGSRKKFDLVHHGVQISRYVEIVHDETVPRHIRDRAAFYLRRLLSSNPYRPAVKEAFRRWLLDCCSGEYDEKAVETYIENFRYEGYAKTSRALSFLHRSGAARSIAGALLGPLVRARLSRRRAALSALQQGIYGPLFDNIREISS